MPCRTAAAQYCWSSGTCGCGSSTEAMAQRVAPAVGICKHSTVLCVCVPWIRACFTALDCMAICSNSSLSSAVMHRLASMGVASALCSCCCLFCHLSVQPACSEILVCCCSSSSSSTSKHIAAVMVCTLSLTGMPVIVWWDISSSCLLTDILSGGETACGTEGVEPALPHFPALQMFCSGWWLKPAAGASYSQLGACSVAPFVPGLLCTPP